MPHCIILFVDSINEIQFAIKEFRKLYEKAPITDRSFVPRSKEKLGARRRLSEIQIEYEMFKKYKMRTAISK